MKFLVILVLALAAQTYAGNTHQYHSSSEENVSSYSSYNAQQNNWNVEKQLEDILQISSQAQQHQNMFQSEAANMPQAQSYKTKISQRIQGSTNLSEKQQLKSKLYKLADEKLENCKQPNGQDVDKQCVGRITGQMMQLISAIENVSHPTNAQMSGNQKVLARHY